MSGTVVINAWQPTAKEALASGVAQMQAIAGGLGRSSMRGFRVNEQEALCLAGHASGSDTSYEADLSDKFERVDAVFLYNKTTDAFDADTLAQPVKATPVSRVIVGTYADDAAPDSVVELGGLELTEGVDFNTAATKATQSATRLVAAVTDAADIQAGASIVDHGNGTFTITFATGVNVVVLSSDDTNLAFVQTVVGSLGVSRVVVGTYSAGATPESVVTLGGLTLTEGTDFNLAAEKATASATELVAAVADADDIETGVTIEDNEDGTFTVTFPAGIDGTVLSSDDDNLTFEETVPAVDATPGIDPAKVLLTFTATDADVLLLTVVGKLLNTI